MKKLLILAFLGVTTMANAQLLEKSTFIFGIDIGLNNRGLSNFEEPSNFSANGLIPVGINIELLITDEISIGYRGSASALFIDYNNDIQNYSTKSAITTHNIYGIYHYFENDHFIIGSGLSIGYLQEKIKINDLSVGNSSVKLDIIFADIKYIFDNNFGLQGNIYMFNGYNTFANVGAFYKF